MRSTEDIGELAQALAKAQGTMKAAKKTESNPFFKSKYTDLAGVWDSIRDVLSSNGLSVVQTTDYDATNNNSVIVSTVLMHSSGQWIEGVTKMPLVKMDPQAVGSAITYARRYALAAIVGVASEEDDDGEAAMGRKEGQATKQQSAPAQSKSRPTEEQPKTNPLAPLIKSIFEQVTSESGLGLKQDEFLPYVSKLLNKKITASLSRECTPDELRALHETLKMMIEQKQQ